MTVAGGGGGSVAVRPDRRGGGAGGRPARVLVRPEGHLCGPSRLWGRRRAIPGLSLLKLIIRGLDTATTKSRYNGLETGSTDSWLILTTGLRAAPLRRRWYDAGLRAHMLRVYNYMTGALALTGAVAYGVANTRRC